ncbi:uncharacterized protein FIBRA_02050 [Fibroporia radiculosa]|uniref:Thioredoxin domain-containing protein n=1 Tax=Fibroporia radiculosa TaxID=599839 RepID=J4H1M3_9APHY|nr:uncharacterized protein FIBRA_02050 [Fibroporia radiculosa]CCM00024.1 predicted protein [Fibroporia radiculosa]
MPLSHSADPAELSSLAGSIRDQFLVFYSSRDASGALWCPDCIAVDRLVQNTFGPSDGPSALIVYVGQKAEWKSPTNPFRGEPWKVESVPTIIRVQDGARLVDGDIARTLASFLQK